MVLHLLVANFNEPGGQRRKGSEGRRGAARQTLTALHTLLVAGSPLAGCCLTPSYGCWEGTVTFCAGPPLCPVTGPAVRCGRTDSGWLVLIFTAVSLGGRCRNAQLGLRPKGLPSIRKTHAPHFRAPAVPAAPGCADPPWGVLLSGSPLCSPFSGHAHMWGPNVTRGASAPLPGPSQSPDLSVFTRHLCAGLLCVALQLKVAPISSDT